MDSPRSERHLLFLLAQEEERLQTSPFIQGQRIGTTIRYTWTYSLEEWCRYTQQIRFDALLLDAFSWERNKDELLQHQEVHQPQAPILLCEQEGMLSEEHLNLSILQGVHEALTWEQLGTQQGIRLLERTIFRHHRQRGSWNEERRRLRLLEHVFDNLEEGVIVRDADGSLCLQNMAATQLRSSHMLAAPTPTHTISGLFLHDQKTPFPANDLPMHKALTGESVATTALFVKEEAEEAGRHLRVKATPIQDYAGNSLGGVVSFRDVTEEEATQHKLLHDATHDGLTQLPNRTLFMDRLEHRVSQHRRDEDTHFAVLLLDLDRFKNVNDSLGHTYGDLLLSMVAKRLQRCLRAEDTIARLGGDEFVLLLHRLQVPEDAIVAAQRIRAQFEVPFQVREQTLSVSTSIGIVTSEQAYTNSFDLLRNADIAMYEAKNLGKDCFSVFTCSMHKRIRRMVHLEHAMRFAIENEEFTLHFQPIYDIQTLQIRGFESLIRWFETPQNPISPGEFIPLAENNGLIAPIGRWVFENSCKQLRSLQSDFPHHSLMMSINLSARQLAQPDLVDYVMESIHRNDLSPEDIHLEITETALTRAPEAAVDALNQLRRHNINVSLDDFGTGYSSLNYLRLFPIDTIKVDRSFVQSMTQDNQQEAIVRTIVELAAKLELNIVAEGVETTEQYQKLRSMGVRYAQGFLFSRAVPCTQLRHLLTLETPPSQPKGPRQVELGGKKQTPHLTPV
ncbi:MAG: EAL domain-containing protein [Deltaproteobacteria bacterium]|nr:MAG: EAL domain-containing protein [Deltaproteobacteria bacterium]